jgi:hypothetical protein
MAASLEAATNLARVQKRNQLLTTGDRIHLFYLASRTRGAGRRALGAPRALDG